MALVLNDHVAKRTFHNEVTGKVSDFAGLILFPLFVVTAVEAIRRIFDSARWPLTLRWLCGVVILTGVVFVLTKTWAPMGVVYRVSYSTAQWPFRSLANAVLPGGSTSTSSIQLVRDTTDLTALVALAVPCLVGRFVMRTESVSPRPAEVPDEG